MVRQCCRLRMTRTLICTECSTEFIETRKHRIDMWRKVDRAYCADSCRDSWVRRQSSERMAQTNRKYASERMTRNNPMAHEAARDKMRATLAKIGHKPRIRGGNGRPTPEPQRKIAEVLGWPCEQIVAPGDGERPYHYKLDVAHPAMKVCVEIDGGSHCSRARRASDARRDARLASLGWLTFRFSNRDAMERTAECVQEVLSSISKWQTRTPTS